jgi:hypothetical protein
MMMREHDLFDAVLCCAVFCHASHKSHLLVLPTLAQGQFDFLGCLVGVIGCPLVCVYGKLLEMSGLVLTYHPLS